MITDNGVAGHGEVSDDVLHGSRQLLADPRPLFGFFSRLPIGTHASLDAVIAAFPLVPMVGWAIGAIGAVAALVLSPVLPGTALGALILAIVVGLTGLNQTDGLLDLGDGLMVHGDVQTRLRVMHEHSAGVGAVAAVLFTYLLSYAALAGIAGQTGAALESGWLGPGAQALAATMILAEVTARLPYLFLAWLGRPSHTGLGSRFLQGFGLVHAPRGWGCGGAGAAGGALARLAAVGAGPRRRRRGDHLDPGHGHPPAGRRGRRRHGRLSGVGSGGRTPGRQRGVGAVSPPGASPSGAATTSDGAYPSLLFGTTSYVLPADLLPNVRLLAPYVDDIELILFEGEASNLPSGASVREIGTIAADAGCGFTVHLPLDVGIGQEDGPERRRAQETCLRVIDLTLALEPHAFVVHPELPLRYHPALGEAPQPLLSLPLEEHRAWQQNLGESLGRLASETGPFPLAVENLQFPFEWVRPLLEEHDLGITLDVGHLLVHGGDVQRHVEEFGGRLTVVHLHGLDGRRDHQEISLFERAELHRMLDAFAAAPTTRPAMTPAAARDTGSPTGTVVVSIEVFGWKPTVASLRTLAELLGEPRGGRFADAAAAVMEELPRWPSSEDDDLS